MFRISLECATRDPNNNSIGKVNSLSLNRRQVIICANMALFAESCMHHSEWVSQTHIVFTPDCVAIASISALGFQLNSLHNLAPLLEL